MVFTENQISWRNVNGQDSDIFFSNANPDPHPIDSKHWTNLRRFGKRHFMARPSIRQNRKLSYDFHFFLFVMINELLRICFIMGIIISIPGFITILYTTLDLSFQFSRWVEVFLSLIFPSIILIGSYSKHLLGLWPSYIWFV